MLYSFITIKIQKNGTEIKLISERNAAMRSLYGVAGHLAKTTIDKNILHLIYYRVSQINGCAFCLDMHSKDLLAAGESVQRLLVLDAWRKHRFILIKKGPPWPGPKR
ncbi:carboxymuconolactone decarboxylase family protein [Niabella sp. W65]|nr:carboxymuconolactone decarboxylase family protein [Niabella sp. W65]MCH7365888.1 carboxymuconolactone decarboxylase family protein [Niabella sp. W65]